MGRGILVRPIGHLPRCLHPVSGDIYRVGSDIRILRTTQRNYPAFLTFRLQDLDTTAAIDLHGNACNKRSVIAGQEQGGTGDILRG